MTSQPFERTRRTPALTKVFLSIISLYISIVVISQLLFLPEPNLHISTSSSTSTSVAKALVENVDSSVRGCIPSISQLKPMEHYPHTLSIPQDRHMVAPPLSTPLTLVCCQTTSGPLSIAVHHQWAPKGADRFLSMVTNNYFSSRVPLMRCVRNFICQFGIAGIPSYNKNYSIPLPDDPNWLPEGAEFRTNEYGVKRFAKGYLAYAGSGKHSRSNQLIVALNDNARLGGGSPWEVPWGEIVGVESFRTLDNIYTGYGEKGPGQHLLRKEGASDKLKEMFPMLDYITQCKVVDYEK